jgi:hypothetical protein
MNSLLNLSSEMHTDSGTGITGVHPCYLGGFVMLNILFSAFMFCRLFFLSPFLVGPCSVCT